MSPQHLLHSIISTEGKAVKNVFNLGQQGVSAGILPPMKRLSWSLFMAVLAICAVPPAVAVLCFSSIGWGIEVYRFTKKTEVIISVYINLALLIGFTLFILDSHLWKTKKQIYAKRLAYSIMLFLLALSVAFSAGKHPYGPICMHAVGTPVWLYMSKHILLKAPFKDFVSWLPGPLFLLSVTLFMYWIGWTLGGKSKVEDGDAGPGNQWSEEVRNRYAQQIICPPNFEEYPECEGLYIPETNSWKMGTVPTGRCALVYDSCLDPFMIWSMPLFVSLYMFFLSHMSVYVRIDELDAAPQGFQRLVILLVFGLWCAASLSASNAAVTNAFIAFLLFCGLSTAVVFIFVHSRKSAEERLLTPFLTNMKKYFQLYGDWVRGFAVLLCIPVAFFYACLSFLTQLVRKSGLNKFVPPLPEEDRRIWLTRTCLNQFQEVWKWRWTSVLQKALIIGLIIQTMTVLITKFTYLFLAWLKVEVRSMNLGSVTLIMIIVGILLFLFPPIPGVPIYFTSGIILVAAGEGTLGTPLAILYTCGVNLVLKLLACSVQQKCIGSSLQKNVRIRQAVGMNTNLIRTMKLVLSKPGFSAVKVAILVGGPDWPTSVLCGILNLPLIPMLIGTLPVLIIIIPTVLSGSFVYLAEDYSWAGTASAISMSLNGLIIMALPAVTMFHIEKAMEEEKEALEKMPYDEEVREAEENEEQRKLMYREITKWQHLGVGWRSLMIIANISMSFSCYLVMGASAMCFEKFTMKDNIEDDLPNGAMSLIKFWGWMAILAFTFATILLYIFDKWSNLKTDKAMKQLGHSGMKKTLSSGSEGDVEIGGDDKAAGRVGAAVVTTVAAAPVRNDGMT